MRPTTVRTPPAPHSLSTLRSFPSTTRRALDAPATPLRERSAEQRRYLTKIGCLLFAAFLHAGNFKGDDRLGWIPIDLTVALAVACFIIAGSNIRFLSVRLLEAGRPVLFLFVALSLPCFSTEWGAYPSDKVGRLFTLTLGAALMPFALFRTRRDFGYFILASFLLQLVICIDALQQLHLALPERITSFSADPISVGHSSALLSLWLILKATHSPGWIKVVYVVATLVSSQILVASGSRGPLIALAATLVFLWILRTRTLGGVLQHGLLSLVLVFGITGSIISAPEYARNRVEEFFAGETNYEATDRPRYARLALESVAEDPFGVGWGGYEKVYTGFIRPRGSAPIRVYPHNMFLEILVEGGVLVATVWVIVVSMGLWRALQLCRQVGGAEASVLCGFFVYTLVGAMFSSDLNDNRMFFVMLSSMFLFWQSVIREEST